jgi:hypothetical protein
VKRRDFVKAMAALPVVRSLPSFASVCGTSPCTTIPGSLRVILEGPFALAINNSSPWSIRAFSPKYRKHNFAFNGSLCDKDVQYGFYLAETGLKSATAAPCIDASFKYFCAENTSFDSRMNDHFLTLHLPAPQRIFTLSSGITAILEDGTPNVPLPGDHVLEYDTTTDPALIRMLGWYEDGASIQLTPYLLNSYQTFKFEVGLAKLLGNTTSDPNGHHAINFHNNYLLKYFPDLKDKSNRQIRQIDGGHPTTTLECKSGGLIATTP